MSLQKMEQENTVETPTEEATSQNAEVAVEAVEVTIDPKVTELEARNRQLFERAKKAEAEAKQNRDAIEKLKTVSTKNVLDVEDYIDISASLEGLDGREKERLAKEHKLTGRSLKEIREDEDFKLWQSAYRTKMEKEQLALKPTGTQSDSDAPKSFSQRLKTASLADKEKLLAEAGLYKSPRPKSDRVNLGRGK